MGAVHILENVMRERLLDHIPHIYRHVCDPSKLRGESFAVVVFPSEKAVLSTVVAKALAKIPKEGNIVALAHNLTQEGFAMLADRNATIFLLHGGFHWTDESYRSVA
jgi:hypothetical protein